MRLTKGGFPARFGGRLSSVLQIDMKEGNSKEFKGDATLGLISSKFTFEGPIIKDKTSFIISGRRTYIDLIVAPFLPSTTDLTLYFYDLNAKINHKLWFFIWALVALKEPTVRVYIWKKLKQQSQYKIKIMTTFHSAYIKVTLWKCGQP